MEATALYHTRQWLCHRHSQIPWGGHSCSEQVAELGLDTDLPILCSFLSTLHASRCWQPGGQAEGSRYLWRDFYGVRGAAAW